MATESIENSSNSKNGTATPLNPENKIPDRSNILLNLYNRFLWLSSKIDNQKTQLDNKLRQRVNMEGVERQFYSVILDGLKDVELDDLKRKIEEIKKVIEERNQLVTVETLWKEVFEIKSKVSPDSKNIVLDCDFSNDNEPHGFLNGSRLHLVIDESRQEKKQKRN